VAALVAADSVVRMPVRQVGHPDRGPV
jgi:hypothetical protein